MVGPAAVLPYSRSFRMLRPIAPPTGGATCSGLRATPALPNSSGSSVPADLPGIVPRGRWTAGQYRPRVDSGLRCILYLGPSFCQRGSSRGPSGRPTTCSASSLVGWRVLQAGAPAVSGLGLSRLHARWLLAEQAPRNAAATTAPACAQSEAPHVLLPRVPRRGRASLDRRAGVMNIFFFKRWFFKSWKGKIGRGILQCLSDFDEERPVDVGCSGHGGPSKL